MILAPVKLLGPSLWRAATFSGPAFVNRFSNFRKLSGYRIRTYSMEGQIIPKRWDWVGDSSSAKFLPEWCKGTTYSRPLCCGEELGQAVKTSFAVIPTVLTLLGPIVLCSFTIRSKAPITPQVLRAALTSLRWRHPDIASIVLQSPPHPSGKHVLTYSTPMGAADLSNWLDNIIICHRPVAAESLEAAIADVRLRYGRTIEVSRPSHSLIVHFIPALTPGGPCGFLLNIAHESTDVVGTCQIVDELGREIAAAIKQDSQASFVFDGQEISRLSKPFPGRTVSPWSAMSEEDAAHVDYLAHNLAPKSTFGLAFDRANAPETTLNTVRRFTPAITRKFVSAARAKGTTFSSLFTAVIALAVMKIDSPQDIDNTGRTHFTIFPFPVNLRKLSTGEIASDRANRQLASALGSALLSIDVNTNLSDSDCLDLIVSRVDECMRSQQVALRRFTSWWDYFSESVLQPMVKARMQMPISPPPNMFPKISSLGVVDEIITGSYGAEVEISQLLMGVRWTLPNAPVVTPQTYKQELFINFTWPECVYSSEKVERFADVTAQIIRKVAEGIR